MTDTTEPLGGEITVFLRAVGSTAYTPEHLAVIALAGPGIESHEDERAGSRWVYQLFAASGVTLQIKDDVIVGALVRLQADADDAAYPVPDRLIDGLPLPARRDAVAGRFGTARQSDRRMDLYLVDDRYLRFDFADDLSTALTVILPGAEI